MTKREKARERLINDITDSGETSRIEAYRMLAALESAIRDEEDEACCKIVYAQLGAMALDVLEAIRARIAERGK